MSIDATDYVLEIRVKDKNTNFNRYYQEAALQDLIHALTALKQNEKFDFNIREDVEDAR